MPMRGTTPEQDYECASIVAALAEVALGKPWVAFDELMAEAYAVSSRCSGPASGLRHRGCREKEASMRRVRHDSQVRRGERSSAPIRYSHAATAAADPLLGRALRSSGAWPRRILGYASGLPMLRWGSLGRLARIRGVGRGATPPEIAQALALVSREYRMPILWQRSPLEPLDPADSPEPHGPQDPRDSLQ